MVGTWVAALQHTNGGVVDAVVPCGSEATLSQRGWNNNSTQPFRGCLHRLQKVVNVPHRCLVSVSVAMHTGQLGLRIQGLPLPGHHLKLARHVSYVCVAAVDGIQLRIPQCEEDNLEALGEFIATAAVGHLPEKPLVENRGHAGEVVSSVGDTKHLRACSEKASNCEAEFEKTPQQIKL